jgi:arabinosaccharide transport system substrate-binding protein
VSPPSLISSIRRRFDSLSPGAWIIVLGAIGSALAFLAWPVPQQRGRDFWMFSPPNVPHYRAVLEEWNRTHPDNPINLVPIHYQALERRLIAAFTSDTPVADLVEVESLAMARAFAGPLDAIGFVDLTDRLRREGLFEQINPPSFSTWTTRGRTFALPHDVHPCLLGYRADLIEAAGIDVTQIETWEDFRRLLAPLIVDRDGDGRPDRYLLNFWDTNRDLVRVLLLQAGGDLFDENERAAFDTEKNAATLASLVGWIAGPRRFCVDARDFTAGGDQMRLEGVVVASILPDWMAAVWKANIPGLAGKVKLMPLPAWERGGRRTSVWGGTAIGVTKAAPDFEQSWTVAKHLYLSPQVAESLYRSTYIISPVKAFWTLPFYHEPDPYFSGQPVGALYIAAAPAVPARVTSPYMTFAMERLMSVLVALKAHAIARNTFDVPALLPVAQRLLAEAQRDLDQRMARNRLYAAAP